MKMERTEQRGAAASAWRVSPLAALLAGIVLAGCATPPAPIKPDPVRLALERAVAPDVDLGLHANNAETPAQPANVTGATITMRNYVGTGQDVLSKVAHARGMKFQVTGPEPHLPLLVSVDMADAKFEDFLSNVSLQFGGRAKVVLGDDRIEIRYTGV
jgi:defect-in-organelle-trafficking protein DotD